MVTGQEATGSREAPVIYIYIYIYVYIYKISLRTVKHWPAQVAQ